MQHIMFNVDFIRFDLRIFDGGGGAGAGASTAGGAAGDAGQSGQQIMYGQPQDGGAADGGGAGGNSGSGNADTGADSLQAEWDALIADGGKFSALHNADVAKAAAAATKKSKGAAAEASSRADAMQPVVDTMMALYGISDGDNAMQDLQDAISGDDTLWEAAADEAGMSIDQYKTFVRLRQQNRRFEVAEQHRQAAAEHQQQINALSDKLTREATAMAEKYPDFDFAELSKDQDFSEMLRLGVSMEAAYKAATYDGAVQAANHAGARQVADSVRANGLRPAENGVGGGGTAVQWRSDPSAWTDDDMAAVYRRVVENGEKIVL